VIRFKDRSSVLGYELLNEPWTGDVYADASLILPGIAGQHLLEPFFNRASSAIRAVDNHTIIFWEPVTYAYLIQVFQILLVFLSLRIRWSATKTAYIFCATFAPLSCSVVDPEPGPEPQKDLSFFFFEQEQKSEIINLFLNFAQYKSEDRSRSRSPIKMIRLSNTATNIYRVDD
jgi:hypothetical protein